MSKKIILITLLSFITAACSGRSEESVPTSTLDIEGTVAVIAGTNVAIALTEIAGQAAPTETLTSTATSTAAVQISPAPTEFESAGVCLGAQLTSEDPLDDAVILAGQAFQKTWWLRNTGTCAWTDEYSFVFQRGNAMGAAERYSFPGYVAPGQAIPFILSLIAPADSGTHRGFWELESSESVRFGVGAGGGVPFYVQIIVPGPTPTPKVSFRGPQTWGNVRSDGNVGSKVEIGDTGSNFSLEGFMTFQFGSIPANASVLFLVLDIDQGYKIQGDPFTDLGCLNVYADNYPAATLWRFCSTAELSMGANRTGGPDAIAAFENAFSAGTIRLTFSFDNDTNDDGSRDSITINETVIRIDWIP